MGSAAPASCFLPELHAPVSPSDRLEAGRLSKSFPLQLFVLMGFIENIPLCFGNMIPSKSSTQLVWKCPLLAFGVPCSTSSIGTEAVAASCLALTVPRSFASSFLLFSGQLLFLFPPLSECCFRISNPGLIDKLKGESPINFWLLKVNLKCKWT